MADLKASHEADAGEVLTSLAGFAPPLLLALAERAATRVPQHNVNTVTTNVPGPQQPLYAAGRRMLEAFGYVPLGGHLRIGVAIFSYNGHLGFGITGDYDTAPDIDVLSAGIEAALAELLAVCPSSRPARPEARRTRPGRAGDERRRRLRGRGHELSERPVRRRALRRRRHGSEHRRYPARRCARRPERASHAAPVHRLPSGVELRSPEIGPLEASEIVSHAEAAAAAAGVSASVEVDPEGPPMN